MKDFNYTQEQLKRIQVAAPTVSIVVHDYDGNATKYLGLNDAESIKAFREFLDQREKQLTKKVD